MYCAFAGNRRSGEVWVQTRRRFGQEWPFWRSRLQKRGVLCILSANALKDSFAGARNDKVALGMTRWMLGLTRWAFGMTLGQRSKPEAAAIEGRVHPRTRAGGGARRRQVFPEEGRRQACLSDSQRGKDAGNVGRGRSEQSERSSRNGTAAGAELLQAGRRMQEAIKKRRSVGRLFYGCDFGLLGEVFDGTEPATSFRSGSPRSRRLCRPEGWRRTRSLYRAGRHSG